MAQQWLRVRVELVAGRGRSLTRAPGRVMAVPEAATFDDFGLGVDLAFGRWDIAHERAYTDATSGEVAARDRVCDRVGQGERFRYVFDLGEEWVHECLVEGVVEGVVDWRDLEGRAPIPVPIFGWGAVPDQYGRVTEDDDARAEDEPLGATPDGPPDDAPDDATHLRPDGAPDDEPTPTRRARNTREPLDLGAVRRAAEDQDIDDLLAAIHDRDLAPALQQVGDALTRIYRAAPAEAQLRLEPPLRDVSGQLDLRDWPGDDVLSEEIGALLSGSERRGRTIHVDLDDLANVMANGGEDPGGYLHLDTGEVVHAFLRHGLDDSVDPLDGPRTAEALDEPTGGSGLNGEAEPDDLWIYLDHDGDAVWQDMATFAKSTRPDLVGILSVALRGKSAVTRFRRTIDDLGLTSEWRTFSDDRAHGRARALLRSQGIRPI